MGNNFRFGTEGFRFAENRPSYDLTGMNGLDVFRQGIASYGARDTLGTLLSDPQRRGVVGVLQQPARDVRGQLHRLPRRAPTRTSRP